MRILVLSLLLLSSAVVHAADRCAHEAPRNQTIDLAGVRAVRISVHAQDLKLTGASASALVITGRACASEASMLEDLKLVQRRQGDQLILDMASGSNTGYSLLGHAYANLKLSMQLPAGLPVTLDVGSGDASVTGLAQLDARVGSGDLDVSAIGDRFAVSVGSGDVKARTIGSLKLGSVGSGDVGATDIRGDVDIGSIGSGEVTVQQVGGNVRANSVGSGDLKVRDVAGNLQLRRKGSGDIDQRGVKGQVSLPGEDG